MDVMFFQGIPTLGLSLSRHSMVKLRGENILPMAQRVCVGEEFHATSLDR